MTIFAYVAGLLLGGAVLGMGMWLVFRGLSGVGVDTSTLVWFGGLAILAGNWILLSNVGVRRRFDRDV